MGSAIPGLGPEPTELSAPRATFGHNGVMDTPVQPAHPSNDDLDPPWSRA